MEEKTTETVKKGNVKALLPIGVFLVLYLGLGILFEYGMGIPMGFYNIPVVVIFLVIFGAINYGLGELLKLITSLGSGS